MRTRLSVALVASALVALLAVSPAAARREFGTIYVDGVSYRTFGTPARVDPGTGTDPIIAFTNFEQGGVALDDPGPGSHGGRWQVWTATWNDPADAHLVTDFGDILALVEEDEITLVRAPEADFRCPILPNG
jgi:hypothetical protein